MFPPRPRAPLSRGPTCLGGAVGLPCPHLVGLELRRVSWMLAGTWATELCLKSQDRALAIGRPSPSETHAGEAVGRALWFWPPTPAPPSIKFKQAAGAWLLGEGDGLGWGGAIRSSPGHPPQG